MSETNTITIPSLVEELLKPIAGDNPCGADVANDEDYFKLNMEIGKVTPDYKLCIELANTILSTKAKDLWVADWLCFSWYRSENIGGLKNGLLLIINLLTEFGDKLFPAKPMHRSKAIQFLNSSRFTRLLETEVIDSKNSQDVIEALQIFMRLKAECEKQFKENIPVLKAFEQVLKDHSEKVVKPAAAPKEEVNKETTTVSSQEITKTETSARIVEPVRKTVDTASPAVTAESKDTKLTSEKDTTAIIRKSISFFFEESGENKTIKIPSDPTVFGLSRSLMWGKLLMPVNKDEITQIDPPNKVIQNKIQEWLSCNDWDMLISKIEINFLKPDSGFAFWFDSQRFVVHALQQKGGAYSNAAEEIKFQLAKLLYRLPGLLKLKFKNKITAFADSDTMVWIDNEISNVFSGSKEKKPVVLPPIMGEDYDPINKDYEEACSQLPENFEVNLAKMQKEISGETRRKGRFLRELNMANFCIQARHHQLAKVHLSQLINKVDEYNLAGWEPALCVSVWQSLFLVNAKLLEIEKNDEHKLILENQQKELFAKIANYDGVLAIKLSNINQLGGN
ncbi:MAG: TssA family type VI secretion system protein [bacterium]